MALITSRADINQGSSLAVATAIWATGTGADIRIHTSASNLLPALATGEFFEVRDHSNSQNNGLYEVVTVNTSTDDYECNKVNGAAPIVAGVEAVTTLGATGLTTEKSVFYDTAGLGVYLLEQGALSADGVTGAALYSHMMQEWKDDNFLIANAPFPMNAIDNDAGKYFIGQDSSGNSSGFNFVDDFAGFAIRTRKLLRNMGWAEIDSAGVTTAQYFGAVTLGAFEAPTTDVAFYQFGTDTTVDNTVDFDFAGPVNEAVQFYEYLADGSVNGGTGIALDTTGRLLTRSDGGNWLTDGFIKGGQVELRDSEDSTMDGTWLLAAVGAGIDGALTCGRAADAGSGLVFTDGAGGNDTLTLPVADGKTWADYGWTVGAKIVISSAEDVGNDGVHTILVIDGYDAEVATASFTANADDTTAVLGPFDDALTPDITINAAIDNSNAVRLGIRVRDGDPEGKTFGEANLVSAGKPALGNFVFAFPLANATDLKITAVDGTITGSSPWNLMSITFHSTPQARAGLVGGPYNFGVIIDGANGTNEQVHEFVQHSLRQLTDIDNDGDIAIGRAIGLLGRFNGDTYEVGSGDGGLTFPVNPDGGGSGVFIDSLNAASDNATKFYDNTGALRSKPESIAVTLDFNAIAIDDTATEYDLFYDRTIRTAAATLVDFVLTATTDVITSATTQLPQNAEIVVGSYVRIGGLTAGDAPMNGVYQILVINTPGASWDVVRYDGVTIVAVASTAVDCDQNCVDTPDAIIVDTNIVVSGTTISFVAPDQMLDSGNGLGVYAVGDRVRVVDSTGAINDGIREVATVVAGQVDFVEQDITTQGTGPTVISTQIFSGDATADVVENFAFDDNVQGGRTVSTTTYVKAKAVGRLDAQYIESPVSTIASGTPLTIPLFAPQERNVI